MPAGKRVAWASGGGGQKLLSQGGALNCSPWEPGSPKGSGLRLRQEGPAERAGTLQKGREFKQKA